jgi:NAD(P) transhydrogenase subunit beta
VGTGHYYLFDLTVAPPHSIVMAFLCLEVLLGSLTFTGSLMAFGKLQGLLSSRPFTYRNQNVCNLTLLTLAITCGVLLTVRRSGLGYFRSC